MPVPIGGMLSFCGRELQPQELDLIRQITRDFSTLSLTELAHTVCELLEWRRPNGGLKGRECFLFLQALHQRGWLPLLSLPPKKLRPRAAVWDQLSDAQAARTGPIGDYLPVQLQLLDNGDDRRLFRQYLQRYHYLGYKVPFGAQLRYFVRSPQPSGAVLACLLFTSAAWKMAPRDAYIGWSQTARQAQPLSDSALGPRTEPGQSYPLAGGAANAPGLVGRLSRAAGAIGNAGGCHALSRRLLSRGQLDRGGPHTGPRPHGSQRQSPRRTQAHLPVSAAPPLARALVPSIRTHYPGVPMNLLETYDSLLQDWRQVFSQKRTFARARRLTLGLLVCLRLHLTSRALCATGRQFVDWSADYRLCSRSVWNPQRLFDPLFDHLPALLPAPGAPVIAALDDTLCKKTGRHIPGVGMGRDPMSPAFHVNLCYGLRFVQVSLLVSPVGTPGAARALPVRFDCA